MSVYSPPPTHTQKQNKKPEQKKQVLEVEKDCKTCVFVTTELQLKYLQPKKCKQQDFQSALLHILRRGKLENVNHFYKQEIIRNEWNAHFFTHPPTHHELATYSGQIDSSKYSPLRTDSPGMWSFIIVTKHDVLRGSD